MRLKEWFIKFFNDVKTVTVETVEGFDVREFSSVYKNLENILEAAIGILSFSPACVILSTIKEKHNRFVFGLAVSVFDINALWVPYIEILVPLAKRGKVAARKEEISQEEDNIQISV